MVKIEDLIPIGEDRAIKRKILAAKLGVSDRTAREMIERARKSGTVILSSRSGGYYRPDEKETAKIEEYVWVESKRARSIFANLKHPKRELERRKRVTVQLMLQEQERRNG